MLSLSNSQIAAFEENLLKQLDERRTQKSIMHERTHPNGRSSMNPEDEDTPRLSITTHFKRSALHSQPTQPPVADTQATNDTAQILPNFIQIIPTPFWAKNAPDWHYNGKVFY